jgi:hypothetical protein
VTALDYRLDAALVPIAEAARIAHVGPRAVHNWCTRGYVNHAGERIVIPVYLVNGKRQVIPLDVLRAEAATRRKAGRSAA